MDKSIFEIDTVDVPNDEELNIISQMAYRQLQLEKQESEIMEKLKQCQKDLENIRDYLLPDAMSSVGISEFTLSNGHKITVKEDIHASIRKERSDEAINWLTNNGLGDIVKDKVEVTFGRGEAHLAKQVMDLCNDNGFYATENLSVHWQTLKATIKEQMSRGVEFPEDYFSVYPTRKTVIKVK